MSKMFPFAVFVLVAASASAQNPAMNVIGLSAPSVLVRETCPQVSTSTAGTSGTDSLCSFRGLAHQTWREAKKFGYGLETVPRNSVRVSNLKWELPILATTGILFAKVDRPADSRIHGQSIQKLAGFWSNVGLGLEIGSGGLAYSVRCQGRHSYLRDTGFKALAVAFAAVIAHRYPQKRWLKWSAYGLATGVALSRYPARRHYPSDILIGSILGYFIGTYFSEH